MNPDPNIPQSLVDWFADCPFALTAFSGGVDSSLVAWLANHLLGPDKNLAVISASPSLKLSDLDEAKQFAHDNRIPLRIIVTREMENENYLLNPVNRCFFCKQTLYKELTDLADTYPGSWILNGTNTEDLGDYRPGLEAAKNHCVRSPLAECGLDKSAVRSLATALKFTCCNKPASPCLSSRIPYGLRVTPAKLRRIEAAETWLNDHGFPVCRVRHLEGTARVEVPPEHIDALRALESDLAAAMKSLGFLAAEIDPEGFVSGKLNRSIGKEIAKPASIGQKAPFSLNL
ncbi:MAG: ATP-dependent sacrificial sulfur transferase LarE [Verrucomicrobia bacterium]|nr:ATP-dependent sacrificial sulfur transferase LarE [Verrucomicrobiota bacterium]MCH8529136.1 ATP-dependent sacrificial sulfur transferase LarE [Kiritimatiellia bacterium]